MQAIKCEMCGSNDIIKDDGLYVCNNCGTKYTVEEARKLMGTVEIDHSTDTKNILQNAINTYNTGDYSTAQNLFTQVLNLDPENPEATLLRALASQWQRATVVVSTNSAIQLSISLAHKQWRDNAEYFSLCNEAMGSSVKITDAIVNLAIKQYNTFVEDAEGNSVLTSQIKSREKTMQEKVLSASLLLLGIVKASITYPEQFDNAEDLFWKNNQVVLDRVEEYFRRSNRVPDPSLNETRKLVTQKHAETYWKKHPDIKANIKDQMTELQAQISLFRSQNKEKSQLNDKLAELNQELSTMKLTQIIGMLKILDREKKIKEQQTTINSQVENKVRQMQKHIVLLNNELKNPSYVGSFNELDATIKQKLGKVE